MRRTTLLRIATKIVEKQREFLEHGVQHLAPLKMQTVADETHMHVSTVSRAIQEKHMQTPQGIFEMRYFFTGGTEVSDGSVTTNESIKQKVMALVENEDKSHPISDDEIVRQLE
jgi:RNA polymerase sigma-54 factor